MREAAYCGSIFSMSQLRELGGDFFASKRPCRDPPPTRFRELASGVKILICGGVPQAVS